MPLPSRSGTLYDALGDFGGGVNSGDSPLHLPPQVMAGAVNTTVRGQNVTHRSCYHKRLIEFSSVGVQEAFEGGFFQGGGWYKADDGTVSLLAMVSGRLFEGIVVGDTINLREITLPDTKSVGRPQVWMWQSEKWMIIQDGLNNPIFFDGTITAPRSNYATPASVSTTAAGNFTGGGIPAIGSYDTINFASVVGLLVGYIVTFKDIGTFQVLVIAGATVTLLNLAASPAGQDIAVGTVISWYQTLGQQLPPGRMGAYGKGRNWMALVDGKQFVAGDIVGGASGTVANNLRDSVLYITENQFIKGGGNFTVPGSMGDITAMIFATELDASLGQGPLQVFTHSTVFSCQAPVDRLTWQSVTNPILTVALIGNGALGQNSCVNANNDVLYRSIDGIRSLILARRTIESWGNVPISFEVSPTLSTDDPGLLTYGSAIVFDNRMLMTVGTARDTETGNIYFRGIVPLNFDPLSGLRGKLPSVWDAVVWTSENLNPLQLLKGEVDKVERAFVFSFNPVAARIELWEIKRSYNPQLSAAQQPLSSIYDNDGVRDIPVTWRFDSASLRFTIPENDHQLLRLSNGEMWISDLQGLATFQIFYKADQYPCWALWQGWQQCQAGTGIADNSFAVAATNTGRPGYNPRAGFGSPPGEVDGVMQCDENGRPLNNGYTFQVRTVIQGHCVVVGEFFEAQVIPQPGFAAFICAPICP